jgi:hypothetical protein
MHHPSITTSSAYFGLELNIDSGVGGRTPVVSNQN